MLGTKEIYFYKPHDVHGHGLNLKRFKGVAVGRKNQEACGY